MTNKRSDSNSRSDSKYESQIIMDQFLVHRTCNHMIFDNKIWMKFHSIYYLQLTDSASVRRPAIGATVVYT
jgi:hypothetical protein